MTAQEIINLALSNTHTKIGQISAANLLSFFNIARTKVATAIIKEVNEDFFFQIWTIDADDNTVATRINGEYLYPAVTSTKAGMLKMNRLAVKPTSTDIYYKPATEKDLKALPHDWSWYMKNQPKSDPIYFIADESIFIAPEFKPEDLPTPSAGNKQIKLYGVAKITNLAATATEDAILVPVDFHETIATGMEQYIYKARSKTALSSKALMEFNAGLQEMIDSLTNRDNSPMIAQVPDDTNLGYGEGSNGILVN